jgi:flavin reductase (DIM6/NTAB) family NADH-FMN oxidoreductase RutF
MSEARLEDSVSAIVGHLFKQAMGSFPAGVAIIASGRGPERRGLTATAVCSVSAEPPRLLVCVNKSAEAHPVIRRHRCFGVSFLGESDEALAHRFAARDGSKGVVRFIDREWMELKSGAPVLAEAVASIDCSVEQEVDVGTHMIFIGSVLAVRCVGGEPLVYHAKRFAGLRPA